MQRAVGVTAPPAQLHRLAGSRLRVQLEVSRRGVHALVAGRVRLFVRERRVGGGALQIRWPQPPARERLRGLLTEIGDVDVIGEAATGAEALSCVHDLAPDVLLLDVRMPGMDGLEAARHLNVLEEPPAVIFTTAYDQYAVEAFEAHAVGYLLKPVRKEQLAAALTRAGRLTRAQLQTLAAAGTRRSAPFVIDLEGIPVCVDGARRTTSGLYCLTWGRCTCAAPMCCT